VQWQPNRILIGYHSLIFAVLCIITLRPLRERLLKIKLTIPQ
jgi:hypothetical protein